jgi:hypothetical protein
VARRKTPRLAYCEYVSPDSDGIEVSSARLRLFEAVQRIYPTFLEKLSAEVFPLYQDLAEVGCRFWGIDGPRHLSPYELINQGSSSYSAGHTADTPASMRKRADLKSALSKWASEFHADRIWLMDDALRTLRGWYVAPEWRESLKWKPFYGHSSSASTGEAFQFECQGWETQLHTWSRYSQWVRQRFEEELLEYEKQTRKLAKSCGLVRAREKYSPANLDWFVLYQFAGRSSTEIASQGYGEDPDSTVLKGIKAAAKLIGWDDLRKSNEKRKRKIR